MFARTPVFGPDREVFGYELFFQPDPGTMEPSARALERWSCAFPFESFPGRRMLLRATAELIPPLLASPELEPVRKYRPVLELLEAPDPAGLAADLRRLRERGYGILLDEHQVDGSADLAGLVDVVRAPLPSAGTGQLEPRLRALADGGRMLLAPDVATHEDQERAARLGYGLFQGEFFQRPPATPVAELPRSKANYILFLAELGKPELDFARVEQVVKREPSLVVRLMRYLNSPIFGVRSPITSVRHALTYLGETPLRRWGRVPVAAGLGEDRPSEIVVTALVRARLCEEIGKLEDRARTDTYFLTGLLSLIDAMLGKPAVACLYELPIDDSIRRAILGEDNPLGRALKTAMAFERADWARLAAMPGGVGCPTRLHCEVLRWAAQVASAGSTG